MKKILSFILAATLLFGLVFTNNMNMGLRASAAAPLGYSVQNTTSGGNASATNNGGTITVGDQFTVTFAKNNFLWSATGDGTHDLGALQNSWIYFIGAAKEQDFSVTSMAVDPTTGNLNITLKALREYSGTIGVYLNGGAGATSTFSGAFTVQKKGDAVLEGTRSGGNRTLFGLAQRHSGFDSAR